MRERGKDKQITHTTIYRHKHSNKANSSNTCKHNITHQEVLVGVAVEQ